MYTNTEYNRCKKLHVANEIPKSASIYVKQNQSQQMTWRWGGII